MVGIINNVHPIILDTVVVSVFVLMIFFGVIKGIKKTSIDLGLFLASLFLGFTSLTNSLKAVIAKNFLNISGWTPAGSDNAYKLAASFFVTVLASLVIFLLFYVLFHVIELLIKIILKKKAGDQPKEPKSKVGRVFAGLISLVYQGAVFVVLMICMNNNFVGMNGAFGKTTVTKFIVENSTNLISKIDEDAEEKLVLKLLKGDMLYSPEEEIVDGYYYLEENAVKMFMEKEYMEVLADEKLTNEEAVEYIKERLVAMKHLANVANELNTFKTFDKEFSNVAEEWLTTMHRTIVTKAIGQVEFTMNEFSEIRLSFVHAHLSDRAIGMYDEIAVGK